MQNGKTNETKLCKYCQTEIPKKAKICPNCRKKQGGILKWIAIAVVVLVILGAASGGSDEKTQQASSSNSAQPQKSIGSTETQNSGKEAQQADNVESKENEKESEPPKEYISVTADELSDALSNNALKAQNDYKGKYLEITGKLGTIDSSGHYISVDTNKTFDLTNIQCYIKNDEQKQAVIEMSRDDAIVVKGYCKDVGEILGYSIDIEEIAKQ